jgi:CRISPR-associated endonuclease/helicase Cas3
MEEVPIFFAHSENAARKWHLLKEHLKCVGMLARKFAHETGWADEAELAGQLHDLGKYANRFQERLKGLDAGLDHWSQGAWLALTLSHSQPAIAAALSIQGHHVGLQRANVAALRQMNLQNLKLHHPFRLALSDTDLTRLRQRAEADGLAFQAPTQTALPIQNGMAFAISAMLDVRLLFSCLVDADFLDTEAHFNGDAGGKRYRVKGPTLDVSGALVALDRYMTNRVRPETQADARVFAARDGLWQACGLTAEQPPGLFTLTAPTGSGKTLAMLHFALKHAARHSLKRIVLAMPYLTIIEQAARVYREVFAGFPEHFVLEHHSLAGLGEESENQDAEGAQERQRRLLSENWDAPIVLTTNVQLLESLFSNRPSACRKLHNLMEAILLFDEAQSLPPHLAVPTLAALSHLSMAYRSTVVFATATQPAFNALDKPVTKHANSGWKPVEVVPDHPVLFNALKRVMVRWPKTGEKRSWRDLAHEVIQTDQVLVVLNLKRHALALLKDLEGLDGVFHLSTNLCPQHRRTVLDRVRSRLKAGETCRLISTQCVEAGVDVDFPKVLRALAPLEAIAQAAGRCNREGRMVVHGEVGVFEPEEEGNWRRRYPTHAYYQATEVTRTMLILHGDLDINDPEIFLDYYQRLYDLNDPASQNRELSEAIDALDFAEIASRYHLIEQGSVQTLVPWADRRSDFVKLRSEAERDGISAGWIRRAQGLAVSVYRPRDGLPPWAIPARLRRGGVSDEWFILEGSYYDDTLGLNPPEGPQVFIA